MHVSLNVYDVTNTANDNTNGVITRLNNITRELNFGGVFHGAIQIEDLEWSFGYCESGTGVYCCRARSNSLYTFREHVELGATRKTKQEIREILSRFKREWPGTSYDLLQRNCCHFCEELCVALGVPSPPAWLNRFAQGADATVKFTNEASALAKRVGSNITTTAHQSALWLKDLSQRVFSQITMPSASGADSSGDEAGDAGGAASPLYARSVSPSTAWDSGSGGIGRLATRFRPFGASGSESNAGSESAAAGISGAGLPASTPSSCCDLPQPQSQSLSMSLRQKWQELEVSTGDGTKQFLFGLIKTRQARLPEEEESLSSGAASGGSGGGRPLASYGPPQGSITPGNPPQVALSGTPVGAEQALDGLQDLNQAPAQQVMQVSRPAVPAGSLAGAGAAAPVPPPRPTSTTATAGAQVHVWDDAAATPSGTAAGAFMAEAGPQTVDATVGASPVRHLLDM